MSMEQQGSNWASESGPWLAEDADAETDALLRRFARFRRHGSEASREAETLTRMASVKARLAWLLDSDRSTPGAE